MRRSAKDHHEDGTQGRQQLLDGHLSRFSFISVTAPGSVQPLPNQHEAGAHRGDMLALSQAYHRLIPVG
jgi:hypothetical protein